MQQTFRCRCGTNLFVFNDKRKANCKVCGKLNLLPSSYWQENFAELKANSSDGAPLNYSDSDSKEVNDWRLDAYFSKVVHFIKTRKLWPNSTLKTNLLVIVTAIVSPLMVGIAIQIAQNRSATSEGRLAHQIDIAQPAPSFLQPDSVSTNLLETKAYFAGTESRAQTCEAFEKVFDLNVDEKRHPNWMSSLNFFECLDQSNFKILGR